MKKVLIGIGALALTTIGATVATGVIIKKKLKAMTAEERKRYFDTDFIDYTDNSNVKIFNGSNEFNEECEINPNDLADIETEDERRKRARKTKKRVIEKCIAGIIENLDKAKTDFQDDIREVKCDTLGEIRSAKSNIKLSVRLAKEDIADIKDCVKAYVEGALQVTRDKLKSIKNDILPGDKDWYESFDKWFDEDDSDYTENNRRNFDEALEKSMNESKCNKCNKCKSCKNKENKESDKEDLVEACTDFKPEDDKNCDDCASDSCPFEEEYYDEDC